MSHAKLIAEPWDVGQMDSYDLGRFPPLWSEWNGKYRDTMRDFWRSHRIGLRRVRHPVRRLVGPVRLGPAPPDRVGQPHHRARRLHPARPRLLRRQAQRGQRRGQPRRHRRQPVLELRRRGPDRRPRHPGPAGTPVPGHARHPAAVVRRADAARRRRARPHPAGQQQRLLPGQRDLLVRLVQRRQRSARLHQAPDRAARTPPGVPPPPLPDRRRRRRAGLVHPGRAPP